MIETWQPTRIAVCVPVRNEEALLPALLSALTVQRQPVRTTISLCFLFDHCTDSSARLVARATLPFAVHTRQAESDGTANAGRARRQALALGQQVLGDVRDAALLTTDADSIPAPDWIAATCRALAAADVVAGRILREAGVIDPEQDRIEGYYDRLHALRRGFDPVPWDPAPGHHHTGGASLAFRADAYALLGGFEPRPAGEDAAIVDAAHRQGLRVRRDRDVGVETSARRHGRAQGGLADHLRQLESRPHVEVAHPANAAWQYRGHARARAAFGHLTPDVVSQLAAALEVGHDHVARVAATAHNAEAFATHVVPAAPNSGPVTLDIAEEALTRLEAGLHERAA